MLKELSRLKVTCQTDPGFKEFIDRKSLNSAKEQACLCDSLPALFFQEAHAMLDNYFDKKWCSDRLLKLVLAATTPMPTAFAK